MAKKKAPKAAPLYTDLANPDDAGAPHFEEADAKRALDIHSEAATYESSGPGQVEQKLGKIK